MSSRFRGIPPRVLLRARDNRGGRYPTNMRTVSTSDRHGAHKLDPYDDAITITFTTGTTSPVGQSQITVPTMLWTDAVLSGTYNSLIDLQAASASIPLIITTDTPIRPLMKVTAGVSDAYIEHGDNTPIRTPFVEYKQFEQGRNDEFFATGTALIEVGPGFTSPLRSKTHIRLSLPVTGSHTLLATTASLVYYDVAKRVFERIGDVTNPADAFARTSPTDRRDIEPGAAFANDRGANWCFDSRLFSPLGSPILTGTVKSPVQTYNCPSSRLGDKLEGNFGQVIATTLEYGVEAATLTSSFAPTSTQTFTLHEIKHPFLLEKVVIELPISVGSGWLNDTTTFVDVDSGQDFGGPCVTVCIMRSVIDTRREIILSGTIIPEGDNIAEEYVPPVPGANNAPHGFATFGNATIIVPSGTSNKFDGTVRLELRPSVSNGIITVDEGSFHAGIPTRDDSHIMMINPLGRALDVGATGRSFFGREFVLPPADDDNLIVPQGFSGGTLFFRLEESATSPYILMPNDRLILAVAKHRPVISDPRITSEGGDRTVMTSSHDFTLNSGVINITFYGSPIQGQREIHFGRNEPLTSYALGEALGETLVIDQFDTTYRQVFSGSYTDLIMTGSILALTGVIDGTSDDGPFPQLDRGYRHVVGSAVASGSLSRGAFTRFVNVNALNEIIYDSYAPPPDDIQRVDDASIVIFHANSKPRFAMFPLRSDANVKSIDSGFSGGSQIIENDKWPFAFPFESRYLSLERQAFDSSRPAASTIRMEFRTDGQIPVNEHSIVERPAGAIMRANSLEHRPAEPSLGYGTSSYEYVADVKITGVPSQDRYRPAATDVFARGFYGFGDAKYGQPRYVPPVNETFPSVIPGVEKYVHRFFNGTKIRGWKYGLLSAIPQRTRMILRRDHHGFLRDVLEQRLFTRSVDIESGKLGDSPVTIRFTSPDPADTDSSNLSAAATSSMPYFDGEVRNRGPLPDNEIVQVDLPIFTPPP